MRVIAGLALVCCLMLAGCGDSPDSDAGTAAEEAPELTVHRPFQAGAGSVNSYWLEGSDEILVFDTQGRLDLARRIVAAIEATGKPVTQIIVSQYDPDHFGGLQVFIEAFPDAELLMTEEVAELIARDLSGHVERLREINGDDYELPPEPDRAIADSDQLEVSGVQVTVRVVEGVEASPVTMLDIPGQRALLSSDLVSNGMHPDLTQADLHRWPGALERLSRQYAGYTVYPGHGEPGPAGLLFANQQAYLAFMRELVEHDILADGRASESEVSDALAAIRRRYSGWENTTGDASQLRRNLQSLVADFGGRMEPPHAGQSARGSAGS